jgi:hypothetical protein
MEIEMIKNKYISDICQHSKNNENSLKKVIIDMNKFQFKSFLEIEIKNW